jgi:hypothetical protein
MLHEAPEPSLLFVDGMFDMPTSSNSVKSAELDGFETIATRDGDGDGVECEERVVATVAGEAGSEGLWRDMKGGKGLEVEGVEALAIGKDVGV